MNRYARHVLTFRSIIGALALVPVGAAFAQEAPTAQPGHPHGHHNGLLGAALKLDSLTAAQRTAIEALQAQRRESTAPVRTANAQVLTLLAQEVEQGSVDTQALAPALGAEHTRPLRKEAFKRAPSTSCMGCLRLPSVARWSTPSRLLGLPRKTATAGASNVERNGPPSSG